MPHSSLKKSSLYLALTWVLMLTGVLMPALAQSSQDQHERVDELFRQQRYTEALPLLEQLAVSEPESGKTQFLLAFTLVAQATSIKDREARKAVRVRARVAFAKAKALGVTEPLVDAMLQSIPEDGSDAGKFSKNPEAESLMLEGEAFFTQGKRDDAFKKYQNALELDPKLYEAALFSGDMLTQNGDYEQAEVWYQKAIAIDPDRETAYRYSATPLMRQKKYDRARDRYVEAYIREPYNRFTTAGLSQWAEATKTELAHIQIDIPTDVSVNAKGETTINLSASALLGGKDDGSFAWISYGATRTLWRKEKFAKNVPGEKQYRHTLAEEVDALRSVIAVASEGKNSKNLSPSLARLKKLIDEGLLEAYILLARPDQGIIQDFPAFRRQNEEKLRRYVVTYVLKGGGN